MSGRNRIVLGNATAFEVLLLSVAVSSCVTTRSYECPDGGAPCGRTCAPPGWQCLLGVSAKEHTKDGQPVLGITKVVANSAADVAGLKVGDRIVDISGKAPSLATLRQLAERTQRPVRISFFRGSQRGTVIAKIGRVERRRSYSSGRRCSKGKACGASCIAAWKTCHK